MQFDNHLLISAIMTAQVVRLMVWSGLVAATITLLVLMRTRWGQSQPLRKCIVLSTLVHLLFGIYTTTVNIVVAIGRGNGDAPMWVAIEDGIAREGDPHGDEDDGGTSTDKDAPWNGLGASDDSKLNERLAVPSLREDLLKDSVPNKLPELAASPLEKVAARMPIHHDEPVPRPGSKTANSSSAKATPIDAPRASRAADTAASSVTEKEPLPSRYTASRSPDSAEFGPPDLPRNLLDETTTLKPPRFQSDELSPQGPVGSERITVRPASAGVGASGDELGVPLVPISTNDSSSSGTAGGEVPAIMQGRVGNDRLRRAIANGGSRDTEAAVVAGLQWLVDHQSQDGRWDANRHEAGRDVIINGENRQGAGSHADTGITGLALLALLAHGNTHMKGEHPKTVQRGLEWLLSIQAANGSLAGDATIFERMYCHAMATCALSEAYALSGDNRLAAPVRQAIDFCVKSQDKKGGGWRYSPGDPGDTSQLGWQVMALKSAELAGIEVPSETRAGMVRFLKSVASGNHEGLASYRPGHRASRTMTAEALVCRQFLGMSRDNPAADEAGDFVMGDLPGQSEDNVYYWYYGTLGMFQLQGRHWQQWNKSLQNSLLKSQRTDGDNCGSWDPDGVWGACGGRVYSTALSALCLEVYYRFLPLYVEAASRDKRNQ